MVLEDSYLSERLEAIASQIRKLGVICPIQHQWCICPSRTGIDGEMSCGVVV